LHNAPLRPHRAKADAVSPNRSRICIDHCDI
jgi:hypothetical protein